MPQKGTFHTTMTDKVRVVLCQYKRDNPQLSQKDLIKWLEDNHSIKVSQATISTTLKRSAKILAKSDNETNLKCQASADSQVPGNGVRAGQVVSGKPGASKCEW